MGHSLPMHSAPVSNNVRYAPIATRASDRNDRLKCDKVSSFWRPKPTLILESDFMPADGTKDAN